MIIRNAITLPGGYELPVAIMTERRTYYAVDELQIAQNAAEQLLHDHVLQSVDRELYAGEIMEYDYEVDNLSGCYRLNGTFVCNEMIAQVVEGKWNKEDFDDD